MTKIKLCNLIERERERERETSAPEQSSVRGRERENFARDPTITDYFLLKANPVANF